MDEGGKAGLAALLALKLVCCGGLLLATGAISLGGLMSLVDLPVVSFGGVLVVIVALGWLLRRALARRANAPSRNDGERPHEPRRDVA